MRGMKKEFLKEIKEKAPELYEKLLTDYGKEFTENISCKNGDFGTGRGQGRGAGRGNGFGEGRQWGGRRNGAGRPKMFCERKTITKQVSETSVNKIKEYAEANNISENEALDQLINAGYENLKN